MSAIPHAHQMEQVFEKLATRKTVEGAENLGLHPQWRLVSRDGSTSSVGGVPETKKQDCPDCLAGRCGQTPQGCGCSNGRDKPTIFLDGLTVIQEAKAPLLPGGGPVNAAMPQARPQLFEPDSLKSAPASLEKRIPWEWEVPCVQGASAKTELSPGLTSLVCEAPKDDRTAPSSVPQPPVDELQNVIDLWPRLSHGTRRAILALVGAASEADSA